METDEDIEGIRRTATATRNAAAVSLRVLQPTWSVFTADRGPPAPAQLYRARAAREDGLGGGADRHGFQPSTWTATAHGGSPQASTGGRHVSCSRGWSRCGPGPTTSRRSVPRRHHGVGAFSRRFPNLTGTRDGRRPLLRRGTAGSNGGAPARVPGAIAARLLAYSNKKMSLYAQDARRRRGLVE